MMGPIRMAWLFVLLLGAALAATLPMRLVLPDGPVSAKTVRGTIWSAQLADVRVGGVSLGTVQAHYRPLAGLSVANGAGLTATLGLDGSLNALNGIVSVSGAVAPFPAEALEFRQVSLKMNGPSCVAAQGRVRMSLSTAGAALPPGEALLGPLRCERGIITARLASQSGLDILNFRLSPDRHYQAVMTVRPANPEATVALESAGFRPSDSGHQLSVSGQL